MKSFNRQEIIINLYFQPGTLENSRNGIKQLAELNPNVGAVICDIDINFTFAVLFEAALHLRQPNVLFMTGATDRNVPFGSNFVVMGKFFFWIFSKIFSVQNL